MTQPCTTAELVDRARGLARGPRRILGIVGAPGAGKSTLAELLVAELDGAAVCVPMDGFHLEDSLLRRLGRRGRKGAIDTFDDAGYAALMQRLAAQPGSVSPQPGASSRIETAGPAGHGVHDGAGCGETVYAPWFDRDMENTLGSAVPIAPGVPLVITEGNYLLAGCGAWPRARAVMDEVWFLDAPEQVRHQRLVARHRSFGKSEQEAIEWTYGTDEHNAAMIASTAGGADLTVRWV